MNSRRVLLATAITSLITLAGAVQAAPEDEKTEKCYGIAKAGKNDCSGPKHVCAGQAKTDGNPKEWLKVPKGTCERIVGGILSKDAPP